jgi:hypothetical protein
MSLTTMDTLMERASRALEATRYFEAERLCTQALLRAYLRREYERMSRILMPLQEARRQKRQLATDAGAARIMARLPDGRRKPEPGCRLLQPPLVAADARVFRRRADAALVPVFVLTREPMTREGMWPIVAVSPGVASSPPVTVRTKCAPPSRYRRVEHSPAGDSSREGDEVPTAWFESAGEALGDAGIAAAHAADHPAWRVDDFMAMLDACPDHEKLHQRLDEACREAAAANPPEGRRPRRLTDDPFSF